MRVFTDGAEFQDFLFWTSYAGLTVTTTASYIRSGNAAYRFTSGSQVAYKTLQTSLSEFYFRIGIRPEAAGASRFPAWFAGATEIGSIRSNASTYLLETYFGTTLVATGSIPMSINNYYLIDGYVKIADSPDGVFQMKIDGILDIDFSGDTKPDTNTTINRLGLTTGAAFAFDDFALNSTLGGIDDSWIGDGKIKILTPNAAGDVTGLIPSAGNNYECVDDFPNDGDTTYVGDTVVDEYDLYNLTPCGLANVDILRVWAEARARDVNAVGGLCKLGVKTEATEYWSAGDLNLLTSYIPIVGTHHIVNPNTSLAWTVEQLDALQAGFKVR